MRTAALAIAAAAFLTAAQAAEPPRLHTNQAVVEEATHQSALALNDPLAVFAYVLDSLPDKVKVYPTENYYYFRFVDDGVPYAGDIRLDLEDRDQGKVHFGYYEKLAGWKPIGEGVDVDVVLDADKGVKVEKTAPLAYRISYRGKQVEFALNDLSAVKPPAQALAPHEKYLGPIFDESAIPFYLLFDTRLKIFHYILDESTKVADQFERSKHTDRILIGKRTGFAFYRDWQRDRKILIGVYLPNSRLNTYYDGPFDQMPENFIKGDELRDAMIASDPTAKGQIDRLGHYYDGSGRFLIHPYMRYRTISDLYSIDRCASRHRHSPSYARCFVRPLEGDEAPPIRRRR